MSVAADPTVRSRGFSLVEVMMALGLLLVGGVSIMSVFTVAVVHRVERELEANVDALRSEVLTAAQDAVDRAAPGKPPQAVGSVPGPGGGGPAALSIAGYGVVVTFTQSPNGDPSQVAHAQIYFRGRPVRAGRLPPIWLRRSTLEPPESRSR
jgi:hypothetical protein